MIINEIEVGVLKDEAENADKSGQLTEAQLNILYKHKLFNLFVPKVHGGLELPLYEGLEIEEQMAYTDASLGWTVTLCSGANYFSGFLDESLASKLFENDKVCLGGSGRAGGIAQKLNNGDYLINGFWQYATGTPHLTAFTINCQLMQNGVWILDEMGNIMVRSFILLPDEVVIHNDWNTMGLKATASWAFEAKNLHVPENRMFFYNELKIDYNYPIYKFPFKPFAECTIAVNNLGLYRHFVDLVLPIFESRNSFKSIYQELTLDLKLKSDELLHLKEQFYTAVRNAYDHIVHHGKGDENQLHLIGQLSRQLTRFGRNIIFQFYPYCGLDAAQQHTELNRIFRDCFTASQHALLTFER